MRLRSRIGNLSPFTLMNSEDSAAWKECFSELAPKLLLFARQWAPTYTDAEDIVQMAFVRWWQRNPGGDRQHVPLLYAAVRTIALDMRRSQDRRTRREEKADIALPHEDAPCFDPPVEDKENAALLAKALTRLSDEQREVVTLRIWGGLTFAEIAHSLGQNLNTITARYRYALAALHKALAPHREDLGAVAASPITA
jgi:RNA polymerase sigma-70 factor, ECF subfamily